MVPFRLTAGGWCMLIAGLRPPEDELGFVGANSKSRLLFAEIFSTSHGRR
jgi:hypothetical protein